MSHRNDSRQRPAHLQTKRLPMMSVKRITELLDYNKDTGIFTWKVAASRNIKIGDIAGGLSNGYVAISLGGRNYQAHRLAWMYVNGVVPKLFIDHINGIRTDNRISNLREATHEINAQNIRDPQVNNKCGLLGVNYDKFTGKFRAQIQVNGKKKSLGRFETKEDAHSAYLLAKRAMHTGCTI